MFKKLKELFIYYFPKPDGTAYTNRQLVWWLAGWSAAILLLLGGLVIIIGEAYQLFTL